VATATRRKPGRPKAALPPASEATDTLTWVQAGEAGRLIGRGPRAASKLAAKGAVRVHRPPGLLPLYCKEDLLRHVPPTA
jgi:hypothetical protein